MIVILELINVLVPRVWRQTLAHIKMCLWWVRVLPVWFIVWQLVCFSKVEKVCIRANEVTTTILVIDSICGIVFSERRQRRAYILDTNWLIGSVKRVHNSKFIPVSVAIKLGLYSVFEAITNVYEIEQPSLSTFSAVWWHVANYVHLVLDLFGLK